MMFPNEYPHLSLSIAGLERRADPCTVDSGWVFWVLGETIQFFPRRTKIFIGKRTKNHVEVNSCGNLPISIARNRSDHSR